MRRTWGGLTRTVPYIEVGAASDQEIDEGAVNCRLHTKGEMARGAAVLPSASIALMFAPPSRCAAERRTRFAALRRREELRVQRLVLAGARLGLRSRRATRQAIVIRAIKLMRTVQQNSLTLIPSPDYS